jgi:molybdate/tungstate transport system permease protein
MGIRINTFSWSLALLSLPLIALIVLPLTKMVFTPTLADLWESLQDPLVVETIGRSLGTALAAALICFIFGTPLAYLMARKHFPGKSVVEAVIDLPIMLPHPVIGIAILSLAGRNHPIGRFLADMGIEVMGTLTGIIAVLTFVGMPFYINTVKAGFEAIPERLENVSRSLGASMCATFFRITFPLAWRSMMLGMIMCTARAISEFGAVIIVAYHPMTAPVLIYERFTAYGLKYSQPVSVWLICVSLVLFVGMRFFSRPGREAA